ncbi:MAG: tRNA pseudouridine(38-40) synthase TruA [Asgard group archaeon]|nr:tRNA pseudouridine(38-40) synthase TruA [Asgard group archaeon]
MKRYAVKIAYLGAAYQGFQRQIDDIKTIEREIITTLQNLGIIDDASTARYSAAGRTDRGVNALGQVIAFDAKREIHLEELNQNLPRDIFPWAIAEVEESFNARRDALMRTYKMYYPYSGESLKQMKKALMKIEGTHDFTKLCKKPDILPNGEKKSTVLTIENATVKYHKKNNLLEFTFSSRSFLWNQIRKMVSLIIDIGSGKYDLTIIDEVFNIQSVLPKGGIKPVPPDGLILYDIQYPKAIHFQKIEKKQIIHSKLIRFLNKYNSLTLALNLMKKEIL